MAIFAHRQDRLVGIVLVLGGSLLFWRTFSFHVVAWDPLGLAFWPRVVLGFLIAAGVFLIIRGSLDAGPFQVPEKRAFAFLLGIVAYALLLGPLGFLIATPLFMIGFHLALGGVSLRNVMEACLTATVCTALVYYVFHELLFVQFPEGLLAERL